MAELKPCPFCGSTEIYAEISYEMKEFRIYCAEPEDDCIASMRLAFNDAGVGNGEIIDFEEITKIVNKLVELWNTRPLREGAE